MGPKKKKPTRNAVKCQNLITMFKKNALKEVATKVTIKPPRENAEPINAEVIDLTRSPIKCSDMIKDMTLPSTSKQAQVDLSCNIDNAGFLASQSESSWSQMGINQCDVDKARRKLDFADFQDSIIQSNMPAKYGDSVITDVASTSASSKKLVLTETQKRSSELSYNRQIKSKKSDEMYVVDNNTYDVIGNNTVISAEKSSNAITEETSSSSRNLIQDEASDASSFTKIRWAKSKSCSNLRSIMQTPQKSVQNSTPRKNWRWLRYGRGSGKKSSNFGRHRSFNSYSPKQQNSSFLSPQKRKYNVPYYLKSFRKIVNEVTRDLDNSNLFNEDDMKYVAAFSNLKEQSQMMYVRLFSRKMMWHALSKLKYSEIGDNLQCFLDDLVTVDLLIQDKVLDDVEQVLDLLSVSDLKNLCKIYSISATNLKRGEMIDSLLRHSKQQTIGSFFQKDKEEVGPSMMMQRYRMLLADVGTIKYPNYQISKITKVFPSRDSLIQFGKALEYESEMVSFIENKDLTGARSLYDKVKEEFEKVGDIERTWLLKLPVFLRHYTPGAVLTRILDTGVDVLQRQKQHHLAVRQLKALIQGDYCPDSRGRWYERLAINLDQHLKQPAAALNAIEAGLRDENVRVGHRHALFARAEKICVKPKFAREMTRFHHVPVLKAPEVTIEGKLLPKTLPGSKNIFIMQDSSDGFAKCGVESLVLHHYSTRGYPEGEHCEGSVIANLFALFFWDIVFMAVPDVFHSQYQTCPLDIYTDHFYSARRNTIEKRLADIRNGSGDMLEQSVRSTWQNHFGERCVGMNWAMFAKDPEHAEQSVCVERISGLVRCIGGHALAGILGRYAKQPRLMRGGFPDLTLWNPSCGTVKFSEVKGPGDRLSNKQILWLDHLLQLGVDAEVARVIGVGTKTLRHGDT